MSQPHTPAAPASRFDLALDQLAILQRQSRLRARNCEYARVYRDKRAAGVPKRAYNKHDED